MMGSSLIPLLMMDLWKVSVSEVRKARFQLALHQNCRVINCSFRAVLWGAVPRRRLRGSARCTSGSYEYAMAFRLPAPWMFARHVEEELGWGWCGRNHGSICLSDNIV